jgi:hypothetical protein
VTLLYVGAGETAEAELAAALTRSDYECVMVGAGLRLISVHFLLFEKLINVVHRLAPAFTRICFNTQPSDTAEAVRRWVQRKGGDLGAEDHAVLGRGASPGPPEQIERCYRSDDASRKRTSAHGAELASREARSQVRRVALKASDDSRAPVPPKRYYHLLLYKSKSENNARMILTPANALSRRTKPTKLRISIATNSNNITTVMPKIRFQMLGSSLMNSTILLFF